MDTRIRQPVCFKDSKHELEYCRTKIIHVKSSSWVSYRMFLGDGGWVEMLDGTDSSYGWRQRLSFVRASLLVAVGVGAGARTAA